jgi:hypothetical protein
MFDLFKRQQFRTILDALIGQIYGSTNRKKRADIEVATQRAYSDLLCKNIDLALVRKKAEELFAGPIPYSTNDLALSVALAFFKDPRNFDRLKDAQLIARVQLLQWVEARNVAKPLAIAFENTLYERFKSIS